MTEFYDGMRMRKKRPGEKFPYEPAQVIWQFVAGIKPLLCLVAQGVAERIAERLVSASSSSKKRKTA